MTPKGIPSFHIGCQSVYAVNEVHRIDDEEDDEDRDGVARPQWHLVDAEESVKIVYVQVAERKEKGCYALNDEFVGGLQSLEVVEYAYKVYHQCSCYDDEGGYVEFDVLVGVSGQKPISAIAQRLLTNILGAIVPSAVMLTVSARM